MSFHCSPPTLIFETGLVGLELPDLARQTRQQVTGTLLSLPPQCRDYKHKSSHLPFFFFFWHGSWGIRTQVLMIRVKRTLLIEPSPQYLGNDRKGCPQGCRLYITVGSVPVVHTHDKQVSVYSEGHVWNQGGNLECLSLSFQPLGKLKQKDCTCKACLDYVASYRLAWAT